MGTRAGTLKVAAQKAGVTLEKYLALTNSGLKRCTKCKLWKHRRQFHKDKSRYDGLKAKCQPCAGYREKLSVPDGFAWCVGCQMFRSADTVRNSRCPQHQRQYARTLYRQNPEFRYKRRQKTSSRRRNVDAVPAIGEEFLMLEFDGRCAYCGGTADTFDHVIPITHGGRTTPDNIVPACRSCNASKGTKDVHEWMTSKGFSPSITFIERVTLGDVWVY